MIRLVCIMAALLGATAIGGAVFWQRRAPLPDTTAPSPGLNAAGPSVNETYRWRPVAIGGGGYMVGMSSDRRGRTFVARTDVHGAYIWRPELDRWVQLVTAAAMPPEFRKPAGATGGVFSIAVAPGDHRRIYMATGNTMLRSSDGGASFRAPRAGPFPITFGTGPDYLRHDPALAVSPRNPDLVLLGTAFDGVLRSNDGGDTWTRANGIPVASAELRAKRDQAPPTRPALVWFVPGSRQLWSFVPGHGMYRSSDDGATFTPLPGSDGGPKGMSGGAFAADGSFFGPDLDGGTVWRYRDGRWTGLVAVGRLERGRYVTVAINPRGGEILAFENNGRAHRSSDGGESWSRIKTRSQVGAGDPPWLRVANHSFFATSQVRFDPVVPNRLWIAAGTGMFHGDAAPDASTIEWTSQTRGIEELVTNDVVQSPGYAPLFAAWDFGIHVRSNLDEFSIGYGPKERVLIAAQQLALTPADPAFVVTNASDTRTCCAEDGDSVLAGYSEDAGRTWHKFETLPQPPGTRADDPWRMAFGMIAVSSGDPDNIVWAPSFDRAPFYTRNRGRTWNRIAFPGEVLPFTGSHSAKHYQRKVLVADPVTSGTFYLAHSGTKTNPHLAGTWRSVDGGATWAMQSAGEVAPLSNHAAKLRAMPGREGHLFFTSAVDTAPDARLRRSNDGGTTWAVVPGVDRVDDVAFGKGAAGSDLPAIYLSGFVRGTYGIWRSVDDARNWTIVAGLPIGRLDRVVVLGADPDVFGRVYIGWMGSGWTYGEPARCKPQAVKTFAIEECFAAAR